MRLDKFLKVSRIIKRRTVANEVCDAGKAVVNGKVARASYDVKVGDVIEIQMGVNCTRARVLNVLAGKECRDLPRSVQHRVKLTKAEYREAVARLKLCYDLLFALPGCPTVYYGDEAGMTGCSDPFCRMPFPWGKEDTDLQAYVRKKMREHRDSEVLRTGHCEIEAIDADTVRIRRFMLDGRDGLGQPTKEQAEKVYTIRRDA